MRLATVLATLGLWTCPVLSARHALQPASGCPAEATSNPKDGCIDAQSGAKVPSGCCHRWCGQQISRLSDAYAERIVAFRDICKLQPEDLDKDQDRARLCAANCTDTGELDAPLPAPDLLERSCPGHEELDTLKDRESSVNALDLARKLCTKADYLDFTHYFRHYQGEDKAAKLPNGKRYFCCCRPDRPSNSVHCVLKSTDVESHAERARRLLYSGCGGAMGGEYVSWNNVWFSRRGQWRTKFDGALVGGSFFRMRHRGQCVARREGIPEDIYATYLRGLFGALVTQ